MNVEKHKLPLNNKTQFLDLWVHFCWKSGPRSKKVELSFESIRKRLICAYLTGIFEFYSVRCKVLQAL